MIKNSEGLTDTYNRFHNPEECDPDFQKLRDLHAEMDDAVVAEYCWNNVNTKCEFRLDYEIDEELWGDKNKPWRYRWRDDVQEDVLARLLELNRERALEEGQAVTDETAAVIDATPKKLNKKKPKQTEQDAAADLFTVGQEEP